uniref:Uncharacterized protein n=1 Tax=Rhipicephalus zambeziensis TaxID=60191 RepID=A0A224YLG0_9ACAR
MTMTRTHFNNNRTSRRKCAIVFVPFRSRRLCTYETLGDRQHGGEPEQYYWSVVVLSHAPMGARKKKSVAMTGVKQVCAFFLNVVFTASAVNCQGLCCLY